MRIFEKSFWKKYWWVVLLLTLGTFQRGAYDPITFVGGMFGAALWVWLCETIYYRIKPKKRK